MGIEFLRACVRPISTLAVVTAVIGGFFLELIAAEAFLGIAILIIKYWFDTRDEPKTPPAP